MKLVASLALIALALLSFRGVRWAYLLFVALGLAYFPVRAGFELAPRACQLVFEAQLAALSLTNYAHIVLFGIFFLMSSAQVRGAAPLRTVIVIAAAATLSMGALVEAAQGITGAGHCRLRDLIPDAVGILLGTAVLALWRARPAKRTLGARRTPM